MKQLIGLITLLSLFSLCASAQDENASPLGTPTSAVQVKGKLYADSGLFKPKRKANWTPVRAGATTHDPSDTMSYDWDGTAWKPTGAQAYNSIAELSSLPAIKLAKKALYKVAGFYSPGDGGGGEFYWDDTATSAPVQGMIIQVPGVATGRFKRRYDDFINVKWFGAVGDSATDNTAALRAAITYLETTNPRTSGGVFIVPRGMYFTDSLEMGGNGNFGRITLKGEGVNSRLILNNGVNKDMLTIKNGYCAIEDIQLDGNRANQTAGSVLLFLNGTGGAHFCAVRNSRIVNGYDYGVKVQGVGQFLFDHSFATNNSKGMYLTNCRADITGQSNFEDNDSVGIRIEGSGSNAVINVRDCYLENNGLNGAVNPCYNISMTAIQDDQTINIVGNYINGQQSGATTYGVGIVGLNSFIGSNISIKNNHFHDCELGALFIDPVIGATNIGQIDFSYNAFTEGTPMPVKTIGVIREDRVWQYQHLPNQIGSTSSQGTIIFGDGGDNLVNRTPASGQSKFNTYIGLSNGTLATVTQGNTGVGYGALQDDTSSVNNTAVGRLALNKVTNGGGTGFGNNTAIGANAAHGATAGSNISFTTAVGANTLDSIATGADGNIAVGYSAASNLSTGSKNIVIGYDIDVPSPTDNGQLTIGNGLFGTGLLGTGTLLSGGGKLGVFVPTPTASLDIRAGTSLQAPLRIRGGTNPATPNDGEIWNDTIAHKLFASLNGTKYQMGIPIGGTPTCTVGTGAGAGATCSITAGSNDVNGQVIINTGTSPAVNADIVTITFSATKPSISFPVISAGDSNTSNGNASLSAGTGVTTGFTIKDRASAMPANSTIRFNYYAP